MYDSLQITRLPEPWMALAELVAISCGALYNYNVFETFLYWVSVLSEGNS